MAFGRRALQIAIGLAAVAIGVGLFAFSEHQRERRHANRPQAIVGRLLELAHLRSSDTIYDLECGDGSVVVTAATRYRARAWCFDIYNLAPASSPLERSWRLATDRRIRRWSVRGTGPRQTVGGRRYR
jgi:hypothetical protein